MTTVRAYAKINLGLSVRGKRPDGYHEIETLFHLIDLHDEIRFEESEEIRIISSRKEIPTDERNLCHRAATLLRTRAGHTAGVTMHLEKHIPVGAGLGGGSSDAGAVLRHLPPFWGVATAEEDIREIALQIGSDVPYFLKMGSAVGTGRGEILTYVSLDLPFSILVCYPNISVSTRWAYSRIDVQRVLPGLPLADLLRMIPHNWKQFCANLRNDFEEVVFEMHPEIKGVKDAMKAGGAECALLSGSGGAVFGIFKDTAVAAELSEELRKKGYMVSVTLPDFKPC
jgi:4-diphosphocytidyl-2-C-methyl-D-erythritol kinase